MSGPESAFETLVGRPIKPEERERLFRIREALGIGRDDPIWTIFVALDFHRSLYDAIPDQIRDAAAHAAATGESAAKAAAEDAFKASAVLLAEDVAYSARKIAKQQTNRLFATQIAIAITVAVFALAGATLMGRTLGAAQARAEQTDRQAWIQSAVGQTAKRLADDQFFFALARCQKRGRTLVVDGRDVRCADNVQFGNGSVEQWTTIGMISGLVD